MEKDSDTRSSFPSPFKQDIANGSAVTSKTDTISFRKCLDMETNAPFLQNGKFPLVYKGLMPICYYDRTGLRLQLNLHSFGIC